MRKMGKGETPLWLQVVWEEGCGSGGGWVGCQVAGPPHPPHPRHIRRPAVKPEAERQSNERSS